MDINLIISISSIVIAVSALGATIYQAYLNRKHNRIAVTPHLHYWSKNDELNNTYSLEVINNGIGPARITKFELMLNGTIVEEKGMSKVSNTISKVFSGYELQMSSAYLDHDNCISPNQSIRIFNIIFHESSSISERKFKELLNQMRLVITYESFYNDSFKLDSDV
ncbi:hypothetical protein [Aliivibrio fischeri]|uniref:hypothetical protein n=1 Tax=Aliivibrio fischeri TaxID=668 RepID=UPI0012D89B75|nr:hypothetical protein [Aliivibrio fischeri]MUK27099.1 hypothetical protein [Aliivibrio fischeri]MUK34613.1 hypothetical protein [Aliivibrio fischeri]